MRTGELLDNRTIKLYPKLDPRCAQVKGSTDYFKSSIVSLQHSISQIGICFWVLEVTIPDLPIAVFATELALCSNNTVQIDIKFDALKADFEYLMHEHSDNEKCNRNECCPKDLRVMLEYMRSTDEKDL